MKQQMTTWGAALLCLSLTSAVQGDDQNQGQNQPRSGSTYQPGQSSDTMGTTRPLQRDRDTATTAAGQPTHFNKASKLIGMDVENNEGEDLGKIKDLVINLENGSVSYAVLSTGGMLGVGEKLLAVPLTAFKRSTDKDQLTLQATKDNISQAQGIGNNWPSVDHPTFGAMPFWQQGATNESYKVKPAEQR